MRKWKNAVEKLNTSSYCSPELQQQTNSIFAAEVQKLVSQEYPDLSGLSCPQLKAKIEQYKAEFSSTYTKLNQTLMSYIYSLIPSFYEYFSNIPFTGNWKNAVEKTSGYTTKYCNLDTTLLQKSMEAEIAKAESLYNQKCGCPPFDSGLYFSKRYEEEIIKLQEIYQNKCLTSQQPLISQAPPLKSEPLAPKSPEFGVGSEGGSDVVGGDVGVGGDPGVGSGGGDLFVNTTFFGTPQNIYQEKTPTIPSEKSGGGGGGKSDEECKCEDEKLYLGLILVGIGTSLLVLEKIIKTK